MSDRLPRIWIITDPDHPDGPIAPLRQALADCPRGLVGIQLRAPAASDRELTRWGRELRTMTVTDEKTGKEKQETECIDPTDIGYIVESFGKGYSSYIHVLAATDKDFIVQKVSILSHGETPGLGGEVDNPRWKALWPGKLVYRDDAVELALLKGAVDPNSADAAWRVDGLSGATITARGVGDFVQFWLGPEGYGPFLDKQKEGVVDG